jgi:broad specificity phosphatase PhoE
MSENVVWLMRHGQIPQDAPRRFVGQRDLPLDGS